MRLVRAASQPAWPLKSALPPVLRGKIAVMTEVNFADVITSRDLGLQKPRISAALSSI